MSKIDESVSTLKFKGDDVHLMLYDNPECVAAIYKAAAETMNAHIEVFVNPRDDTGLLEWTVSICSPEGRRTLQLRQNLAFSTVHLSNL